MTDGAVVTGGDAEGAEESDRAYLARVRSEIDEEVRRRRAAGELPPQLESELEQLFLKHAPHGSTRQELHDVLRLVDAAAFIDPVVPVASRRPGGTALKKSLRSLTFWYLRFVTHQVSSFAAAVARSLHILDQQLSELAAHIDAVEVPTSVVIDTGAHRPDAWWVSPAVVALGGGGRVLHAACGDGWLVTVLTAAGADAYGVDPRPDKVADHELGDLDLREEPLLAHLGAVEPAALGAVVLTGVMEGSAPGERRRILGAAAGALGPDGVLVVHSLTPTAWAAPDAPMEADLAPGRPFRPATWGPVLADLGLTATVTDGPTGGDYLVVARRSPPGTAPR